jgi:hypothetical protein
MWELKMTNAAKEWTDAGTFETLAGAAGRIIELEGYPTHGVFLNFHVLAGSIPDSDEEALRVFHHTGKRALYGIRRARAN